MTPTQTFAFRPWVRRTGLSVVLVAAALSATAIIASTVSNAARYGWASEPAVVLYLIVLWLGGLKVFAGTFRFFAQVDDVRLVLRPLHMFRTKSIEWSTVAGTEQLVRGDRLIVYFQGRRGMRFVAVNLNLVKGRREFLQTLEERLRALGFQEKLVGESRYLSKGARHPGPGT